MILSRSEKSRLFRLRLTPDNRWCAEHERHLVLDADRPVEQLIERKVMQFALTDKV